MESIYLLHPFRKKMLIFSRYLASYYMKRYIWLLLTCLPIWGFSQELKPGKVEAKWNEVERLIAIKNFTQTLPILADIKAEARRSGNQAEWVRAFLAEGKALEVNQSEDSAFLRIQKHFEDNIRIAEKLDKSVLQNFYALYLFSNINRYASKSQNKFVAKDAKGKVGMIDSIFRLSISDVNSLSAEPVARWKGLFVETRNMSLNPTLYHFLGYQYLDFLNTLKATNAADKDKLKKQLLAISTKNDYPDASSYIMSYDWKWNNIEEREGDYLEHIKTYKSDYNAFLLYRLAASFNDIGKKTKAITYLEQALKDYPKSAWISNVDNLTKEIKKAFIQLNHKRMTPTDEYVPFQINHTNVDTLYIRVYNTSPTVKDAKDFTVKYDSASYQTTVNAAVVYEEQVALKAFKDYTTHNTIYKINPLKAGTYTILIGNNKSFQDNGQDRDVAVSQLIVSDAFLSGNINIKPQNEFVYTGLLLNRKTGAPYANEMVELYQLRNKALPKLITQLKTNAAGEFNYKSTYSPKNAAYLHNHMLLLHGEKTMIPLDQQQNNVYYEDRMRSVVESNKRTNMRALSLMDRAIYRPGQKVYFKTILYDDHVQQGKVLEKQNVKIYLQDANRQKIDSISLTTNLFGSVHASFQLPSKALNGNYNLLVFRDSKQLDQQYFQVEEYKRPTFEVTFEPNKFTYTSKDTAVFVGKAESLSGVSLVGAAVKYKVSFYNAREGKDIVYSDSTTTVDEKGNFTIRVPLMDRQFHGLKDYVLVYRAEVINQTGEMQMASGDYTYSSRPWQLQIQVPNLMEEKKWRNITILKQNQNGFPLKFSGKVNIYKLEQASLALTDEYRGSFARAEYHLLSKDLYNKYFPLYFDPASLDKEEKKTKIASYDFDNADTSKIVLDSLQFDWGRYQIEAISIQEGDTVRAIGYTSLYRSKDKKLSDQQFFSYRLDKVKYKIGDQVTIHMQTDVKNAKKLLLFRERASQKLETKVLSWKEGRIAYQFVLTEQDVVGQLQLNALFLVDNKMTLSHIAVPISQQNKELTIQTKTFRDKITPGQKEKWSFTVKQEDKPIATEVLATMYDASLDAFASHALGSFQFRYPYYPRSNNYYIINAFQQQTYSGNIFTSNFYGAYADNRRDEIYNYDLLSARRGFIGNSLEQDATYEELIDEQAYRAAATLYFGSGEPRLRNGGSRVVLRGMSVAAKQSAPLPTSAIMYEPLAAEDAVNAEYMVVNEEVAQSEMSGSATANGGMDLPAYKQLQHIKARTNLQETAFFYPNLYTDEAGNISFEFDSPEALTKWKLLLFAHDQHLASASGTYFTQTQKQLMLRPNIPRYFRTNDQLTIKAQIQNLSKEPILGNAKIELIDPRNNQVVSTAFQIDSALKNFSVEASNNSMVAWSLKIPAEYPTIQIRIVAAGGEFSDGEIVEIPVLPNKILIGDTEKIVLKAGESKNFTVKGSAKDNLMGRIQVQSNPILEILSALDYLKNYPYECNEQLSSKWFGLKMAQYIQLHYPAVTDYFKKLNVDTRKGRLEENSSLNEFKMEEMPWLRDVQGDAERLKKIAAFFGTDIQAEINTVEQKIRNNQSADGSFPWFDGGEPNTEISIRMLEIIGKVLYLDKSLVNSDIRAMASKLTQYLDRDPAIFSPKSSTDMGIDYLFARRYWTEFNPIPKDSLQLLQSKLLNSSLSSAGRSAGLAAKTWIVSQIFGQGKQSMEIKNRLDQEAVIDLQKGMYWKSNENQYNKISLQSYLVEAYKINNPAKLNQVTQWIYYNKQINHWYSTWMTVDAIYALLLANNPKDFVTENTVAISINNKKTELSNTVLGEVSKQFDKVDLQTDLDIQVQNHNERTVYGAVVHQYFADLDQIKSSTNALSVQKVYLVERKGQWVESKEAKLGERIKVRITVVNDEPMQYIHLKDSRPAGVEPLYSPSGYQWRKNYYFSSKDASTNYFMDRLPKGRSMYEYEVKANNLGIFNSGITTIESMYDPGVNARSTNTVLTIVP